MLETIIARIEKDLEYLKQFTATPGNGCTRLPFSQEARAAVNYLAQIMHEAGMEVHEDVVGNIFGTIKGADSSLPCVMMGSHFDSVFNGGDFDGIAGIICAIEVARQLKDEGFVPNRDFVVAGFMDEEGCRFGTGYFGSGAMLGRRDVEYCKHYTDKDDINIYDAMKSYGLDPEQIEKAAWPEGSIGQFLEAHIEQGPVLDTNKIELGLVNCIVGIQRYMVSVHGRADHAGTTPMDMRKDAVEAATKVISKIPDWAREQGDGTVATTGYIKVTPGGMNIVAEQVDFTVDIRSTDNEKINTIADKIRAELDKTCAEIGGSYDIDTKLVITPVMLSEEMLDIMEEDCKANGFSYKRLPSGAGHDALEIGQSIPTVMLFVPSKDGRSHCPVEYTPYEAFGKAALIMTGLAKNLLAR